jgi:hypothetical protein
MKSIASICDLVKAKLDTGHFVFPKAPTFDQVNSLPPPSSLLVRKYVQPEGKEHRL